MIHLLLMLEDIVVVKGGDFDFLLFCTPIFHRQYFNGQAQRIGMNVQMMILLAHIVKAEEERRVLVAFDSS
jgi:hypothetical protein